jgi:dolichol-phosphate mannosyltransferase
VAVSGSQTGITTALMALPDTIEKDGKDARPSPELSIILPTYNERQNVSLIVAKVASALPSIAWEVIFVDDNSPDGTYEAAKVLAAQDSRVRCIRRIGRRGLSGACIEGILSSASPFVAVMDADLQHDETILPKMLSSLREGADLAVGSRHVEGGSQQDGFNAIRAKGSQLATGLAQRIQGVDLADPMSGFFMLRRETIESFVTELSKEGFKVLLDIVASSPKELKIIEIPYAFRARNAGESKLDSLVTAQYLGLVITKLTGGLVPIRFLMFAMVGALGIIVHLSCLYVLNSIFKISFGWSQLSATMIAMTFNYLINNIFTYRDKRLRGMQFWIGLLTFYAVCSFGTLANVSVARLVYDYDSNLPLLAGLAGALMSAIFNYAATRALTWRDV